jgi:hypothetical protein
MREARDVDGLGRIGSQERRVEHDTRGGLVRFGCLCSYRLKRSHHPESHQNDGRDRVQPKRAMLGAGANM